MRIGSLLTPAGRKSRPPGEIKIYFGHYQLIWLILVKRMRERKEEVEEEETRTGAGGGGRGTCRRKRKRRRKRMMIFCPFLNQFVILNIWD